FAMAAPTGKGDALMSLLGSSRTLDTELELVIDPAPSEANYQKWYRDATAWLADIVAPVKAQFGGGAAMDAYLDMFRLIGTRGFQHKLAGKALTLSWRTDRIQESDIAPIERELERAVGTTPP